MIRGWILLLGLLSSLQTVWLAPVAQTKTLTKPTSLSSPPLYHSHDSEHECGWCAVIDPTAHISALCESCRTVDDTTSNILKNSEAPGENRKASISDPDTSAGLSNKRRKSVCPDHNTGTPRTFCIDCQKNGTGGGGLCKGGHGKQKHNCKECHPDDYRANLLKKRVRYTNKKDAGIDICPGHGTGKPRTFCVECQKAGTGGGGLCIGGHGKKKSRCKECHPEMYEASRFKSAERDREARKRKKMMMESLGQPITANNVTERKFWKHFGSSENDSTKCSCGKSIDPEDPLCSECAEDLSEILE